MPWSREEYLDLYKNLNQQAIDSATAYLKGAVLANGGAAIAVMGFVASLAKSGNEFTSIVVGVADALMIFALGVVVAVAGMGLTYITSYFVLAQLHYSEGSRGVALRWGKRCVHGAAIICALGSLIAFAWGAWSVRIAIVAGLEPA